MLRSKCSTPGIAARRLSGHVASRARCRDNQVVANPDRLSGLDASFLHLECDVAHMHVGSCLVFDGAPPAHDELLDAVQRRLHLVPRYRQRLAFVPFDQGRPVWVDDPHFNVGYHIRSTALPGPGSERQLERLAGRLFSQGLDRDKPLWELWLVHRLAGERFALIGKTHHCLVDGISGVDITTVLFDADPEPAPLPDPEPWVPRPLPSDAQLLADALVERATVPGEIARGARAALRGPRNVGGRLRDDLAALGAFARAGAAAPPSPLNVPTGPHRRFTWVDARLDTFKAIKDELGGTVNDVVLTVVALALGRFLRRRGVEVDELELKAMVPVSVRADAERGALGNRVAAMYAPLPVGTEDPLECFAVVHAAMGALKHSGQAVGAQVLTELAGFAPPTIVSQAARLVARQRFFNLVVTNVPGPQFPLYLLGRRLRAIYPQVPLAPRQALGVAIMSYDGNLHFGLLGDFDALPDLAGLGTDLHAAIEELGLAAGIAPAPAPDGEERPLLGFEMPRTRGGPRTARPRAGRA
jgi:WS/DGAT/MGAT family acyltransferase